MYNLQDLKEYLKHSDGKQIVNLYNEIETQNKFTISKSSLYNEVKPKWEWSYDSYKGMDWKITNF